MQVVIEGPETVSLRDPEDFRSFSVATPAGMEESAAGDTLARLGLGGPAPNPGHVFVSVDALRSWLGAEQPAEAWQGPLADMVAYAGSHGWTEASGTMVMAHLVPLT